MELVADCFQFSRTQFTDKWEAIKETDDKDTFGFSILKRLDNEPGLNFGIYINWFSKYVLLLEVAQRPNL